MPAPQPHERMKDFIARYMGSPESQKTFPNQKQRVAVAYAVWKKKGGKRG